MCQILFYFVKEQFNPLSANPTKWSNTLKQFVGNLPTNCLSVFDHFVGLALKGLNMCYVFTYFCDGHKNNLWLQFRSSFKLQEVQNEKKIQTLVTNCFFFCFISVQIIKFSSY